MSVMRCGRNLVNLLTGVREKLSAPLHAHSTVVSALDDEQQMGAGHQPWQAWRPHLKRTCQVMCGCPLCTACSRSQC